MRFARVVRKVGYLGPIFPDGQGDHGNSCVPIHMTTQILTEFKNSDNELKQTMYGGRAGTQGNQTADTYGTPRGALVHLHSRPAKKWIHQLYHEDPEDEIHWATWL